MTISPPSAQDHGHLRLTQGLHQHDGPEAPLDPVQSTDRSELCFSVLYSSIPLRQGFNVYKQYLNVCMKRQTDIQTNRQTDRHIKRNIDIQTRRQIYIDGQTNEQKDRQTLYMLSRWIDRQTCTHILKYEQEKGRQQRKRDRYTYIQQRQTDRQRQADRQQRTDKSQT